MCDFGLTDRAKDGVGGQSKAERIDFLNVGSQDMRKEAEKPYACNLIYGIS